MFKAIFATAMMMVISSSALAATPAATSATASVTPKMSCAIGVYRAKDFLDIERQDPSELFQIVSVDLVEDVTNQQEFQIGGETVFLFLQKFEHTDLFSFTAGLSTPASELPPGGPGYHAIVNDHIFNDGPTSESGWDINPGPNATRFAFLENQGGAIGLTKKMITTLKAAGAWGKHPYVSPTISVMGADLTEFVEEQVKAGNLKEDDIVGIAAMLSCTLEK